MSHNPSRPLSGRASTRPAGQGAYDDGEGGTGSVVVLAVGAVVGLLLLLAGLGFALLFLRDLMVDAGWLG